MPQFANVKPGPLLDGVVFVQNALLPAQEGDLFTTIPGQVLEPIPVLYAQSVFAVVEFNDFNVLTDTASYVVLQTDLGDGQWIDLAWCTSTSIGGSKGLFCLSAGAFAANSFQQTRASGTAPSPANGSNSCPLGGRIRFAGQGTYSASQSTTSSNPSGGGNGVFVNIIYKLLGLR